MKIIYVCPTPSEASGGVAEIYRHVAAMNAAGSTACIYHPKGMSRWLSGLVGPRIDGSFMVRKEDFFVIPDIWVRKYGPRIKRFGGRYCVLVQGGFLIDGGEDDSVLVDVYRSAEFVISASESIDQFLRCAFPWLGTEKIVRVSPFVSKEFSVGKKERLITYMPRRNCLDANKVCLYLGRRLPPDWSIYPIHDMGVSDVAALLARASIFMAFSEREGFGLPPLEAFFSGCKVIGYHAQGGREFFAPPAFDLVDTGNLPFFCDSILNRVSEMDAGEFDWSTHWASIEPLRLRYQSKEVECYQVDEILRRARRKLQQADVGEKSIRSVLRKPILGNW